MSAEAVLFRASRNPRQRALIDSSGIGDGEVLRLLVNLTLALENVFPQLEARRLLQLERSPRKENGKLQRQVPDAIIAVRLSGG